jgi:hypothetical protein
MARTLCSSGRPCLHCWRWCGVLLEQIWRVCGIVRVNRLGGFGEPVRRAGKACLIAKGSRIPADWARPPWLAHFALQAGLTCTAGDGAAFCWSRSASMLDCLGEPVRRAGKACLIAKGSRIPADWARLPWLAHVALQAGLTCIVGDGAGFLVAN